MSRFSTGLPAAPADECNGLLTGGYLDSLGNAGLRVNPSGPWGPEMGAVTCEGRCWLCTLTFQVQWTGSARGGGEGVYI